MSHEKASFGVVVENAMMCGFAAFCEESRSAWIAHLQIMIVLQKSSVSIEDTLLFRKRWLKK